jgi:hypothetical protein
MLETVTHIISRYPATLTVGVAGLLIQSAWSVVWISTAIGLGQWSYMSNISDTTTALLSIYIIFVFYWTSQVIKNTVHITVAGLFGTYYFLGVADDQGHVDVPVRNPTWMAARRAMSTSLGPNCYGIRRLYLNL